MAIEVTGKLARTGLQAHLHVPGGVTDFDADERLLRRMSAHIGRLITVTLDDKGWVKDFKPIDIIWRIPPSRANTPGGEVEGDPLTRENLREELARALTPPKPEPQPEPTLVLRQYGENKRLRVVEKREARDGEAATWVCEEQSSE